MLAFYVCPLVTTTTPWGTTTRVGRVYTHRTARERYTLHRGLGELVICSLEDPAMATQAAIAADQECVEWPRRDVLWSEVGATRRRVLVEALSAHGVPLAWVDPARTTAGDVLHWALVLATVRQRGELMPVAQRAIAPSAELEMFEQMRRARQRIVIQGVRI